MKSKSLLLKCAKHFGALIVFLFLNTLYAQQGTTVTGVITDSETNTPLPGVNVIEKGTRNGTSTDFDGNFTLTVSSSNAHLELSYIGYKTLDVAVAGKSSITVALEPDAQSLNEVVVVGYGSVKKKDLTGSVGTVGPEALTERNITDPLEALQGNIAGVQIASSTGRLGDGYDISIRGQNTFNPNAQPLFVVDGVPTDGIDFLNPQDIARIDVLKDASSTAIYGSRGSNGVVIVTTKNGSTAKAGLHVSFDSFFGIKEAARIPDFMNGEEWFTYHKTAYAGGNWNRTPDEVLNAAAAESSNSLLRERAANGFNFDWVDAVLKTGVQQNNYVNISGRSESGLGYNIGIGAQNETGNIENESLDKYTFKAGIDHRLNNKFTLGVNLTFANTVENLGSNDAMESAFRFSPLMSPYDHRDGSLIQRPGKVRTTADDAWLLNKTSTVNPLVDIANVDNERTRWNGIASAFLQYNVNDWLSFKTSYSGNYQNLTHNSFFGALSIEGGRRNNMSSAQSYKEEVYAYTWDNQFNIDYSFNEDHNVKLLGLQTMYANKVTRSFQRGDDFPFESTSYNNIASADGAVYLFDPTGTFDGLPYEKNTLLSYALRLNYDYKGKYLLTLSNRWDGSSLLGNDRKWDSFPSAALAWRMIDEDFMANQSTVSDFKIRVGYGFTGNNVIDTYSTQRLLNERVFYDYNGATTTGWLDQLANSELGWEKTREYNIGLDFGFFNNRITGSVDYYDKLSDDLLLRQRLPVESGYEDIVNNIASVSNKGIEVLLNTVNVQTSNVRWETTFTFTKNNNNVESISDGVNRLFLDSDEVIQVGKPLNSYYNYKFNGIIQENEAGKFGQAEGEAQVLDVNNDGVINPDDDRMILGNSDPDWSGSFFTKLSVGNFDISASVIASEGQFVYSPFHANFLNTRDRGRNKLNIKTYIPQNAGGLPVQPSNDYPLARGEGDYWNSNGVGYYKDVSFVKVKNISLGYNFNDNIIDRLKMKNLRVYANVLNPFVFSDFDGLDPEWAGSSFQRGGVSSITYQLGLSVKF
ncbi:SusC/RagA family TonB-linked outer membrane protein [Pseudotamlana carrageenivorans]|uniref:SusC/RagA family TonB-linked outer membrane protein n=1 Tax=Pseudotamlana carrageenivorans TaxID=2069432 RepID=A0A2I7SEN2_9FLAO|nr:TonB-dependent receptor [Tamlana carrageenivorans]AUS04346.1 SusC/RagA family TonB-linked outer membrane protein [Tamlana carrageenivorans]